MTDTLTTLQDQIIQVPLADLQDHPQNYLSHPADQIDHLVTSIEAHGVIRPIAATFWEGAWTVLAGHGLKKALLRMGWITAPVYPRYIDPFSPEALHLLAADNGIPYLADRDDRALTELLKAIRAVDSDALLGTGYDDLMLANLVYVTRPASEIASHNEAEQWVGMPGYDEGGDDQPLKLIISFRDARDRVAFVEQAGIRIDKREALTWTTWYPFREREDLASLRFKGA